MQQGRSEFHSLEPRDPVVLFSGEGMLLFFEDEEGSRANGLNNNPQSQIERFCVLRKRVRESSFERTAACFSACLLPRFRDFVEYLFLDQCPEPPDEHLSAVADWNLQAPSDKEPRLIYYALIRGN